MTTPKFPDPLPAGYDVVSVDVDDAGAFTNTWSDGTVSPPTNSIEHAIVVRQRAVSIALRVFLKRKKTHG